MKKLIMFCLLAIFLLHGPAFGAFNFIDNGDGTVMDARTGLVWLKNANPCGTKSWYDARTYCASLANGMAGLTDGSTAGQWRLPSKEELQGIGTDPPATWESGGPSVPWTKPGAPFTDVATNYWSSTSYTGAPLDSAWGVYIDGGLWVNPQKYSYYYVWAVRGPIVVIDTDGDGNLDINDNCPNNYNPDQADADANGIGDRCDTDYLWNTLQSCQSQLAACGTPTAISLSALQAMASNAKVTLKWNTETEPDNAGFNIWRAEGFKKINESIIPALGSPLSGSEYDFVDEWVLNGKRYFYLLEDIDNNGISIFHGPVKAVQRWWK